MAQTPLKKAISMNKKIISWWEKDKEPHLTIHSILIFAVPEIKGM